MGSGERAPAANPEGERRGLEQMTRAKFTEHMLLALKDGSIWPAFQPIISLRSRKTAGFEILARWSDVTEGPIGPDRFIQRCEDYNLIDHLTERLLGVAALQFRHGHSDGYMAINITPKQLLRSDLPERIVDICYHYGIAPNRMEIEVTENSLMMDPAKALSTLRDIDRLGMRISIDDFGTGYSSLSRLESFPFHKLKIDAQFVRNVENDASKRRIVAAIIGLGHSLDISLVAEGIETEEQAQVLTDLGCNYGQGYLFGRPSDASCLPLLLPTQPGPQDELMLDHSPFQQFHQLQTLYSQAPVGLCFIDMRYRYVQLNSLFADMHARKPHEMIGRTIDQILEGPLLERVQRILDEARVTQEPLDNVFNIEGRIYRVLGNTVRDISGETIGFSLVSTDITEQERLVQALEDRDAHYRHLVELTSNIGWAADRSGTVDYMSPFMDSSAEETMEDRIARWYHLMHPEDGARVRREWLAHIPTARTFETSFRILWNGHYRSMTSRATPHTDPDGEVMRWYGVIFETQKQS